MARASRAGAERQGRFAESVAAIFLRLKGYRILAVRVRLPLGEIDLVARTGQTIVFVEVKTRARIDAAAGAVTPSGWRRISRAADAWMASRPALARLDWRYDLVALAPGRWPVHVRDAWRPGLA